MKQSRRTALVAGGAGFIGSHLCEALLAEGMRVICVDNLRSGRASNLAGVERDPRFTFVAADVIEPLPPRLSADYVLNLACVASPPRYQRDPTHTLLSSVLGTRNLLQMAAGCRARFLLASTSEVYGEPAVHPQPESYRGYVNAIGPRACYDEGKRAAETLCFDHLRHRRVEVRVARIFNTYGPRMAPDDGRVVSNVVTQALRGEPLTVYGEGQQTRSFCFVEDMVRGLMALLTGASPGPINLGNPEEVTVMHLIKEVRRLTRSTAPIAYRPLPVDDPHRRCPDITLARTLLGWSPRVSLSEGLAVTIAHFEQGAQATGSQANGAQGSSSDVAGEHVRVMTAGIDEGAANAAPPVVDDRAVDAPPRQRRDL